jgi:predicted AlkP superfamily phosphohydrolase/phosphomutase
MEADRILGETMSRMGANDRLMIVSDHGFAPFRRAVHLNRWLVKNGYMQLQGGGSESGPGFTGVDWEKTRAYALGLNSHYINRQGRESRGIVGEEEAQDLNQQIIRKLQAFTDPANGNQAVLEVFDGAEIYPANGNGDAPDPVVGYAPGYRASWQTTLGATPKKLVEDNDRRWSGDHCMAPGAVPGVLFSSFPMDPSITSIADVAHYIFEHWRD